MPIQTLFIWNSCNLVIPIVYMLIFYATLSYYMTIVDFSLSLPIDSIIYRSLIFIVTFIEIFLNCFILRGLCQYPQMFQLWCSCMRYQGTWHILFIYIIIWWQNIWYIYIYARNLVWNEPDNINEWHEPLAFVGIYENKIIPIPANSGRDGFVAP